MKDVQVAASINVIEAKVGSFRQELESINHSINIFKHQIEELSKKPDIPSEFSTFKTITEAFVKDFAEKNISFKSALDSLRGSIESIKSILYTHDEKIKTVHESIPLLEQHIFSTKDELAQKIISITSAFSNRLEDHEDKQKKQIEKFSTQAMSAPKSVIESNKTLLDQIELAKLDGANALLKASNLELSIRMLERKLENLTLQVKKSELSQQV